MIKEKWFKITVFIAVFLFTFILRGRNYDRVPTMGHLEELMFVWSGMHLIERGVPRAWTSLDFPKRAIVYDGRITYQGGAPDVYVTLVEPWLEHPPLFSLLVGWFAHIYNANRDEVIPSSYYRVPMIFIAGFISILIFLIAQKITGFWTGILAMLLYGTTPIIVLGSRMAVPENLIAGIYLFIIYILLRFKDHLNVKWLIPIPILIGIAGLSKATGFFILFLVIYFLIQTKFFKSCLYLVLTTIPFVGLFFAYGLYFDPEIFWRLTEIQSSRPVGFASLAWFFTSPAYDIIEVLDSWFVFMLLMSVYFLLTVKEDLKKFIILAFFYWIIIVMMSGGATDLLPWYRYPSFPLLAIIGAWGVAELVKRADFFATILAAGMLLGNRHLMVNPFHQNIAPMQYRIIFSSLVLPSLLSSLIKSEKLITINKLIIIVIITVGLFYNSVYIYNAFEIKCENISCPFGPSIDLSTLMYFPVVWRFFIINNF